MTEEVKHIQVNGKYMVQIERSAVKGVDGFKVQVNGDEMQEVQGKASELYGFALGLTKQEVKED